jgi:GNAT superfamily N-acetyltransferase
MMTGTMILGRYLEYAIRRSPEENLFALAQRIPGVHYERFDVYEVPVASVSRRPAPEGFDIRVVGPESVDDLARCRGPRDLFEQRFSVLQDRCVAAMDGSGVVGFEWLSVRDERREPLMPLRFEIPASHAYAYDAFVLPAFRGRGLWAGLVRELAGAAGELGRPYVFSHVSRYNELSQAAHRGVGFTRVSSFRTVGLGGVGFTLGAKPRRDAGAS